MSLSLEDFAPKTTPSAPAPSGAGASPSPSLFKTGSLSLSDFSATPTPAPATPAPTPIAPVAPVKTEGFFSKSMGLLGKASTAIGNFFDTPENKDTANQDKQMNLDSLSKTIKVSSDNLTKQYSTLDKTNPKAVADYNNAISRHNDLIKSYQTQNISTPAKAPTMKDYLPSSIAENFPFVGGIFKQLHAEEAQGANSAMNYYSYKDMIPAIPGAVLDTAKGFVKSPIQGATELPNLLTAGKLQPQIHFKIPGLGEVTNSDYRISQAIAQGADPVSTVLAEKSTGLLDSLFFAGIVSKFFSPRMTVTAKGELPADNFTNNPDAINSMGPKSFREYTAPTKAVPLTPEFITKMQDRGANLGPRFDPKLPTFFRMTFDSASETFKGQVVQVKPSWASKIFGGASFEDVPPGEVLKVGEQKETTIKQIESGAKEATVKNPSVELTNPETVKTLVTEAKDHINTVGENGTALDLKDKLIKEGATPEQATHISLKVVDASKQEIAKESPTLAPKTAPIKVDDFKPVVSEKTPTPTATSYTPAKSVPVARLYSGSASQHNLKSFIEGTFEGERYTSNAYILEFKSDVKVPLSAKDVKSGKDAPTEKAIKALIPTDGVPVTPDSVKSYSGTEHISLVGKDITVTSDRRYYDYFLKKYPGAEFLATATNKPILVKQNGVNVGLIMPTIMDSNPRAGTVKDVWQKPKETQKEVVKKAITEKPLSIKEVAEVTKILEPNVRRILGTGAKDGTFERVSEDVYTLKTAKGNSAYIEMGDAKESLARMVTEGKKFDSIILDPAYYSRALIGGNRGIKADKNGGWDKFIMPADFANVMQSVSELARNEDSHIYLMLSGARTAQPDMAKYVDGAINAGLKVVGEGKYTKLFKDGSPVTNVRGEVASSERLILLTKSGTAREGEIPQSLDFRFIRPAVAKSYQTEKPAELMKALIEQSTLKGEHVLDPFAGSGVTGAEAIKAGRDATLIEKQKETIDNFTKPRIEEAAKEIIPDEKPADITSSGEEEMNTQGGFINPSEIVASVRTAAVKTAEYIQQTNENIKFSNNLDDDLYKGQKNATADQIENHKLLASTRDIPMESREKILQYRDAEESGLPAPTLTEEERAINDNIINPLYRDMTEKASYIKNAGVPFTFDENYSHRIVKDKGGTLDKLVEQKNKIFPKGDVKSTKNILKKSAPSLKHREMFSATSDQTGERMVIHNPGVKDGNITAFQGGKMTNLGPKKQLISPRTKEFFDKAVTPVLWQVAKDLGLTHEVTPLKGNKAGLSFNGQKLIQTHPGAPERVLIHEIGHQIDEKYGMQEIFKKDDARNYGRDTMKDEMRAVADLKAGPDATVSYKNYTRKGAEKIAQMFEAYLHVPEQFKEVAPNLYEKFDEFLGSHPELAPIREIEKSLEMGMTKLGGQHIGGIKGSKFIDINGNKYTLGQATIEEIEANTNVAYYHDPIVSAIFAHEDVTAAFRAVQLLEELKSDPKFIENSFKSGEGLPPPGWKTVALDQFRGYYFEPHTATVLNAFAQDIKSGDPNMAISALSSVNGFLINTMFMSPFIHPLRVASSAFINKGFDNINPLTYPRAIRATIQSIKSVATQDEDYIKILRSGVPTMSARVDRDIYRQNVLDSLGEKSDPYAKIGRKIIKFAGDVTPFHWAHALTWPGNDMITHQQVREELAKAGLTVKSATPEQIFDIAMSKVFTVMPTYRLPVGVRTVPKWVTKNTLLFASYRYNLVRTFFEIGHTLLTGNEPGKINMGKTAWKARYDAVGKVIMMAILTAIITPYINDKLKKMTGNNNAYLTELGEASVINNANEFMSGKINMTQYIQTMIDLPPGTKEILQQFATNTDWFTKNEIQTKGTPTFSWADLQQRGSHMLKAITPFDLTQKIQGGSMTIGQLLEAQIGIHTPKGNALVNILQGSSAPVLAEIDRLNTTALPPSSIDIQKRPDVEIFKSQLTAAKYNEAMNQFTGLFISNVAKLMDNKYMKPATSTSITKKNGLSKRYRCRKESYD